MIVEHQNANNMINQPNYLFILFTSHQFHQTLKNTISWKLLS